MKKYMMMLLVSIFAVSLAVGISFAADGMSSSPDAANPSAGQPDTSQGSDMSGGAMSADPKMGNRTGMDKEKMSVTGTIKSIDKAKDMMVVTPEGGGTDMTFKVKSHDAKKFKDGEKVTVSYEMKGGEMVAKKIKMAQ